MELVLFSLVLRSIELCLVTDVFCVVLQVCLENLTHTHNHTETWFPKIGLLRSVYSQVFVFLSQEFTHSWLPPEEEPHSSHSISNCLLLYSLLYPRQEYPIYRQKRALFEGLTHAWRLFLQAINLKHAKNQIQSYPPVKFEGRSLSHLGGFPTF